MEEKKSCSVVINGIEYVRRETLTENYVIVRTYSAGVFAGNLMSRDGKEVVINNARRIWYWKGAASLSQLAMEGTKAPQKCKFTVPVSHLILTDVIEYLAVTKQALASIKGTPTWKK